MNERTARKGRGGSELALLPCERFDGRGLDDRDVKAERPRHPRDEMLPPHETLQRHDTVVAPSAALVRRGTKTNRRANS